MRAVGLPLLMMFALSMLAFTGCGWTSTPTDPAAAAPDSKEGKFAKDLTTLLKQAQDKEKSGHYSSAMSCWEQVVELVKEQHGDDAWQTRNATLAFEAAKRRSELTITDRNLIEQLAISEASGMKAVGTNPREAAYHLAEAEKLARKIYGEDSHLVRNIQMGQAEALAALGDTPSASEIYSSVYAWRMKNLGRIHPDTLEVVSRLGLVQQQADNLNAAVENLNAAVEIARQVWGDEHGETARHLSNLAMLEEAARQYDRAAIRLEDVLTIRRNVLTKQVEAAKKRLEEKAKEKEGETYTEPTLAELTKMSPLIAASQEAIVHTLYNLGNVELKRGHLKDGTDYLGEGWKYVHPDGKGMASMVGTNYSRALCAKGEYATAETVMLRLKEWQEAAGGETHPGYGSTLYQLAIIQGNQQKFAEAAPNIRKAVELEKEAHGDFSTTLQEMLAIEVQILKFTGDIAAAESAQADLERLRGGGVQTATRPW